MIGVGQIRWLVMAERAIVAGVADLIALWSPAPGATAELNEERALGRLRARLGEPDGRSPEPRSLLKAVAAAPSRSAALQLPRLPGGQEAAP